MREYGIEILETDGQWRRITVTYKATEQEDLCDHLAYLALAGYTIRLVYNDGWQKVS